MRLGRGRWVWLILPIVWLGGPDHAAAQAAHTPRAAPGPDAEAAAARAAHERGLAAREEGDWSLAYSEFLSAWEHKRHWEIAVNLGEAEMKLGKYEDARAHLSFVQHEPGFLERSKGLVDAESEQIAAWLKEAGEKLEARRRAAAPSARASSKPDTAPRRTWVWIAGIGGGLFAAGVASGGVMTAMAADKVGEVNASLRELPGKTGDPASVRCEGTAAAAACRVNEERLRSADAMQSAATALFATAGAIAAATTVLAVVWPDRREGAPVVAPVVGGGAAGVAVSASW